MNTDTLLAAMPGLLRGDADRYLAPMQTAMREFDITSELRAAMWLAQVGHESLSLRYFEEIASGAAYEGRRDLGNTQPGDGVRFKGRGPIQITGRANYTNAAAALKLPLVDNPPMAADPQHAFRVSAWWWSAHGLNPISDTGDVEAATRRINGGLNGIDDRRNRYRSVRGLGAGVIPQEEDLPLNDADKDWIRDTIKAEVNLELRSLFVPDGGELFGRSVQAAHEAIGQQAGNFVQWAKEGSEQAK